MKPIEALSGNDRVTVPGHLLSGDAIGDHYALRVVGDSMINEGIQDGDFVICLRTSAPVPGDLVVAVVGDEAFLKFYFPEDGGIVRLQPANPCLEAVRLPARDVRVQSVVVGLMRRYARGQAAESDR